MYDKKVRGLSHLDTSAYKSYLRTIDMTLRNRLLVTE